MDYKNIIKNIFLLAVVAYLMTIITSRILSLTTKTFTITVKGQNEFTIELFSDKEIRSDTTIICDLNKINFFEVPVDELGVDRFSLKKWLKVELEIESVKLNSVFGEIVITDIDELISLDSPWRIKEHEYQINNVMSANKNRVELNFINITNIWRYGITEKISFWVYISLFSLLTLYVFNGFNIKKDENTNYMFIYCNIIFISLLIVPFLSQLLRFDNSISKENKRLQKFPDLFQQHILNDFPKLVDSYLLDHFPFKSNLISQKFGIDIKYFGGPFSSKNVVIGDEDYVFWFKKNNSYVKYLTGELKLTDINLRQLSKRVNKRKNLCQSLGSEYLKVYYPSKSQFYFQKLPKIVQSSIPDPYVRIKTIKNHLKKDNLRMIGFEAAFKKSDKQLYRKLDTHWNQEGAYLAYNHLMNQLTNSTKDSCYSPLEKGQFKISYDTIFQGDLTKYFGEVYTGLFERDPSYLFSGSSNFEYMDVSKFPVRTTWIKNKLAKSKKTIVIFSDSYVIPQRIFYSNHFSEVYYFRDHPFDAEFLEEIKPDLVIDGYVERTMNNILF